MFQEQAGVNFSKDSIVEIGTCRCTGEAGCFVNRGFPTSCILVIPCIFGRLYPFVFVYFREKNVVMIEVPSLFVVVH